MADYCWTKPSAEPIQNSRTTTAETIQNKSQFYPGHTEPGPTQTTRRVRNYPLFMLRSRYKLHLMTIDNHWLIRVKNQSTSTLINGHQFSSMLINGHQLSSMLINAHQHSSTLINAHQCWSKLINAHQC